MKFLSSFRPSSYIILIDFSFVKMEAKLDQSQKNDGVSLKKIEEEVTELLLCAWAELCMKYWVQLDPLNFEFFAELCNII